MNKISNNHSQYLKKLKIKTVTINFFRVFILVFFIFLWEILAKYKLIDSFITSSPSRIIHTIKSSFVSSNMLYHTSVTLYETIIAFLLSMAMGLVFSTLLWWFNILNKILEPHIVVINALPKIALGPIIILWAGANQKAIIVMALLITIIVTILNLLSGFTKVEESKIRLFLSLKATKMQILTKLVLPSNIPTIVDCMKINVGLSWVGTIMGEYLVSSKGLGYLIVYGKQTFKLDLVMTSTILLCIMAAFMYFSVELVSFIIKKKYSFDS